MIYHFAKKVASKKFAEKKTIKIISKVMIMMYVLLQHFCIPKFL
jgi:hypothetical protein